MEENNIVSSATLCSFTHLRTIKDEVDFRAAYSSNNATAIKVYDKFQSMINEQDKNHKTKNAFTLDAVIKRITTIDANSLRKESQMDEDDESDQHSDVENDQHSNVEDNGGFDSEL